MVFIGESGSAAEYDKKKFEEFARQTSEELFRACCDNNGRLKHIIRAEHFNLEFIRTICETAEARRG